MISLIIPTYKSPITLDLAIKSAIDGQKYDNQIVVVVDGFYDLNKHVLQKYEDRIFILDLETNHGLCKATNYGVYNSTFDKILVINDDNVLPRDWDKELLEVYKDNTVITPNQIEPTRSVFLDFKMKSFGDPEEFDWNGFYRYAEKLAHESKTLHDSRLSPRGSTLPFFMSKQDYLKIGGWDESYPGPWMVDWDFFYKCDLAGYDLPRCYTCNIYHFVSYGTTNTTADKVSKRDLEKACWEWFIYKWGFTPYKGYETNNKIVRGN